MGISLEAQSVESQPAGAPPLPYGVLVLFAPRRVFARIEDTPAYGWGLTFLIGLMVLIGYAKVQTGLIDRDVDEATERGLAAFEKSQGEVIDRVAFREHTESVQKEAEFTKMISRLGAIVLSPLGMLASLMLIASVFYAVVALTGRKPEYHTLMSICVYSAYIELSALILQLAMMLFFKSTAVDTTLRALGRAGEPTLWAAVDPFRIWFWVLVAIGLITTQQLSRWKAIIICTLMCGMALGLHAATVSIGI
ncbi:MAG: YIP1 family protein [Planctomycetes bacterium]|nr:YIP1 family protein [Planctomycetota bacterium]MBI3834906.1 YIP1 family protein [Planctomycetota bacterium]